MTDFTYDNAKAAARAPASVRETPRRSFWRRMFEGMVEARMRQAERMVKEHKLRTDMS